MCYISPLYYLKKLKAYKLILQLINIAITPCQHKKISPPAWIFPQAAVAGLQKFQTRRMAIGIYTTYKSKKSVWI